MVAASANDPKRLFELSFDHLVGTREQSRGNFEAERLSGLEIHDQLELCRLLGITLM